MSTKKEIIIRELKKVSTKLGKDRFNRDEFMENKTVPISYEEILKELGSFSEAMVMAGLKPTKWKKITDEELFKAYDDAFKKLGHYPLGHPGEKELSDLTPYRGGTFRKRFGGLKNLLFEYRKWVLENESGKKFKERIREIGIVEEQKIDLREIVSEDAESFDNKQRYVGKAAENLIVSELLFKGFNAQILQVDEGIDIVATNIRKNEIYLIQVKHTFYEKSNRSRTISITKSSFEKNKKSNVYYIIVLNKGKNKREYLILPFHKVDELIANGYMNLAKNSKKVTFSIRHEERETAFIGDIDVSRYLDAWDLLL